MNFKELLPTVKAFAFDVDGVLSPITIPVAATGEPLRMANIKDGYALQLAVKKDYPVAIITGGHSEAMRVRYNALGVQDIYLSAGYKIHAFNDFLKKHGLQAAEVLYMGDDIPDYEVMRIAGVACCPCDAAPEIKAISQYVSAQLGGYGCCRDVIEQVLKAQHKWMENDEAFGW